MLVDALKTAKNPAKKSWISVRSLFDEHAVVRASGRRSQSALGALPGTQLLRCQFVYCALVLSLEHTCNVRVHAYQFSNIHTYIHTHVHIHACIHEFG